MTFSLLLSLKICSWLIIIKSGPTPEAIAFASAESNDAGCCCTYVTFVYDLSAVFRACTSLVMASDGSVPHITTEPTFDALLLKPFEFAKNTKPISANKPKMSINTI